MACHTFNVDTEELDHGIEFDEKKGKKWICIKNKGRKGYIYFCNQYPPKRIDGLTLHCGELAGQTVRTARSGDIALIHIHKADEVIPLHPEVVVHGNEMAVVQLVPGTSVQINGKRKFVLTFKNGQIFKEAA